MRAKASAEPAIAVATPNGSSRPNRSRRKNASSATAASVFNATAPPVAGIGACPPPISRPAANAMSPMRRTGRTAAAAASGPSAAGNGQRQPTSPSTMNTARSTGVGNGRAVSIRHPAATSQTAVSSNAVS